jgi:hypothetical protein
MLCGWPRLKIFEMPMPQRAISAVTLFGIYILLICVSCSFYVLILRKRGQLRNNKVKSNISGEKIKSSEHEMMTNQLGNVLIQGSHTADVFQLDNQIEQV